MIWIEWVEPYNSDSDPVYLRVTPEVAIKHAKAMAASEGHVYTSDEEALTDFMVVNWGAKVDL